MTTINKKIMYISTTNWIRKTIAALFVTTLFYNYSSAQKFTTISVTTSGFNPRTVFFKVGGVVVDSSNTQPAIFTGITDSLAKKDLVVYALEHDIIDFSFKTDAGALYFSKIDFTLGAANQDTFAWNFFTGIANFTTLGSLIKYKDNNDSTMGPFNAVDGTYSKIYYPIVRYCNLNFFITNVGSVELKAKKKNRLTKVDVYLDDANRNNGNQK